MKTVRLLNLDFDVENITAHSVEHFTQWQAIDIVKSLGKRLPTKEEFGALCRLPQYWDDERKGRWFAENEEDLGNPEKSLFLPAVGYRYTSNGSLFNQGSEGYYWASTQYTTTYGISWCFNSGNSSSNYWSKAVGYSLRCVQDLK